MEKQKFVGKVIVDLNRRINRDITEGAPVERTEVSAPSERLEWYEQKMASGEVIEISFDSCDMDGNLYVLDSGITITMGRENLLLNGKSTDTHFVSKLLWVPMKLRVVSVDRDAKRVTVCFPNGEVKDGTLNLASAINREIARALEAGQNPVLWCKVTKVTERVVYVDILNEGVNGMIDSAHWQKAYTRSLTSLVKEGEYYKMEVIKRRKKEGKPAIWILSRKNLTVDPWKNIDMSGLGKGTAITITCTEKPVGKTYWWGVSDRLPGIEIMCDYSTSCGQDSIVEGVRYICNITKISYDKDSEKSGRISAVPFIIHKDDVAKVTAYRALHSRQ